MTIELLANDKNFEMFNISAACFYCYEQGKGEDIICIR